VFVHLENSTENTILATDNCAEKKKFICEVVSSSSGTLFCVTKVFPVENGQRSRSDRPNGVRRHLERNFRQVSVLLYLPQVDFISQFRSN